MTFQLICWGAYPQIHPKINLPVYPHASPLPKNNDLPVTTTTCVPANICTHSWPYLFIFLLSFRLTVKIYPSTFPLFYMSTDVPGHRYTCSVYFSFFGQTCAMTFQLIYWGTYTQIHLKVNLPVYLHASLSSNHKGLPVATTTCVHAHRCTRSWPYLFIFILAFRLTVYIYPSTVLLFYMSTDVPVNHKDLPVTTTTCVYARTCTRSWPYLFIFILVVRLTVHGSTVLLNPSMVLLFYMYTYVPVHHYTSSDCFFFFGITCTKTFQLIYWGTFPQIHLKITCFMLLFCLTIKTYLSPQLLVYMPVHVPVHDPTCSFLYLHSD